MNNLLQEIENSVKKLMDAKFVLDYTDFNPKDFSKTEWNLLKKYQFKTIGLINGKIVKPKNNSLAETPIVSSKEDDEKNAIASMLLERGYLVIPGWSEFV